MNTKIFDSVNKPTEFEKQTIVNFLFENLEQYGDPKYQINKAIEYSLKEFESFGGFTMLLQDDKQIIAAVVINQTGMGDYIPENILVYIAVHNQHRGEGVGSKLLKSVVKYTKGDIALHVEANNPAKRLYEKFGFTNPYLEMRLKK